MWFTDIFEESIVSIEEEAYIVYDTAEEDIGNTRDSRLSTASATNTPSVHPTRTHTPVQSQTFLPRTIRYEARDRLPSAPRLSSTLFQCDRPLIDEQPPFRTPSTDMSFNDPQPSLIGMHLVIWTRRGNFSTPSIPAEFPKSSIINSHRTHVSCSLCPVEKRDLSLTRDCINLFFDTSFSGMASPIGMLSPEVQLETPSIEDMDKDIPRYRRLYTSVVTSPFCRDFFGTLSTSAASPMGNFAFSYGTDSSEMGSSNELRGLRQLDMPSLLSVSFNSLGSSNHLASSFASVTPTGSPSSSRYLATPESTTSSPQYPWGRPETPIRVENSRPPTLICWKAEEDAKEERGLGSPIGSDGEPNNQFTYFARRAMDQIDHIGEVPQSPPSPRFIDPSSSQFVVAELQAQQDKMRRFQEHLRRVENILYGGIMGSVFGTVWRLEQQARRQRRLRRLRFGEETNGSSRGLFRPLHVAITEPHTPKNEW
ncbi:hypothetical protein M422DRAFT_251070 [Sphaerobolus stellatus SS14]|uniref:Uncharacterized protein n=1 Tax=Sphaerobolus stellatus (strain SS14) TaxID=990650 RepID=A0A0C9VFJ6_SPHS4|nr:hypothetical protein M422DRAFT_251070 [Sphaerobolus stellatus SS14]